MRFVTVVLTIIATTLILPVTLQAEPYSSEYTRKWAAQREAAKRREEERQRRAEQAKQNRQNIKKLFNFKPEKSDEDLLNQPVAGTQSSEPESKPVYTQPSINPLCHCRDEEGRAFYGRWGDPNCDLPRSMRVYEDCEPGFLK
ncbi:MAG: hypothetical protein ABW098_17960 [Candidatus Thiodiazotropha sp.]